MSEHELRQRRRTFEILRNAFISSGHREAARAATSSMVAINDELTRRMGMRP